MIVTMAISVLGVLQIYSATNATKWADAWWKQILWILTGLLMMWVTSMIDYHALLERVPYFYVGAVVLLVATAVFGQQGVRGRSLDQSSRFYATNL